MVKLKRQMVIILILSFSLSLIPNFLYTKEREVSAGAEECQGFSCPPGCSKKYDKKTESCSCINCPIPCKIGGKTFVNKSCLPLEGAGEWVCGEEIPIGEVIDRSSYLAGRMLAAFGGMIEAGRQMADKADEILTDYKDWQCTAKWCQTGCYKFYHITAGVRKTGQDPRCPAEAKFVPRGIYAGDECKKDVSQCKSCAQCGERCCWTEEYTPDPKKPEEVISCQYCKKEGVNPATGKPYCQEMCSPYSCQGCCGQYFWPIINGYAEIEKLESLLVNDIEEKTPDGKKLPDDFKFRRSYILEQLDFSRCELAQCWIPAEDYPEVMAGKKVGKHLFTCETASQMGLFDDDQINCLTLQIEKEWEKIEELWAEMAEKPWWQRPVVFFQILGRMIKLGGRIIWEMIKEEFDFGKEEGCYPTNFYCCLM